EYADVVLAELPFHAKDGTLTQGDRRIERQRPGSKAQRDERDGVAILSALASALGGSFAYGGASAVMAEAAQRVPGYVSHSEQAMAPGETRALGETPTRARAQA